MTCRVDVTLKLFGSMVLVLGIVARAGLSILAALRKVKYGGLSLPLPLNLKRGSGGVTLGKIFKFYIAVGEFYSISEAINVVSGHGLSS